MKDILEHLQRGSVIQIVLPTIYKNNIRQYKSLKTAQRQLKSIAEIYPKFWVYLANKDNERYASVDLINGVIYPF